MCHQVLHLARVLRRAVHLHAVVLAGTGVADLALEVELLLPADVEAAAQPVRRNLLPMKIFFAVIALGLFVSVCSGLYMAWRFGRRPRLFGAVLLGGIVLPLLLLLV